MWLNEFFKGHFTRVFSLLYSLDFRMKWTVSNFVLKTICLFSLPKKQKVMLNILPLHYVPSASQVRNKTYFTGLFPWNDMTTYYTIEMSNLLLLLLCLYTLSYLGSSQNLHSTRFFTTSSPYHFLFAFDHPFSVVLFLSYTFIFTIYRTPSTILYSS